MNSLIRYTGDITTKANEITAITSGRRIKRRNADLQHQQFEQPKERAVIDPTNYQRPAGTYLHDWRTAETYVYRQYDTFLSLKEEWRKIKSGLKLPLPEYLFSGALLSSVNTGNLR